MSKVDLMLILNETLQKARKGVDTRFSQVKYVPPRAISALLTEKANAWLLISRLLNALIWATKTVYIAIVEVEVLEQ